MIDIRIPKEIRTYKEKFFFGLTLRQSVCTGLALAINIPLYFLGRDILGDDLTGWLVILTAIPLMAIGFINYNGMTFEELAIAVIKFSFIYPRKRIYKSENLFRKINEFEIKENKREGLRCFLLLRKIKQVKKIK